MSVLLVAGFVVFVAGLVTIAFGIPIKEFSFGDTLVVSGAVVTCTGLIMISLSVVVRELRRVADQLGSGAVADRDDSAHTPILSGRHIEERPLPLPDSDRVTPNLGSDRNATPSVLSPRRQADVFDRDRETVVAVEDAEFPASSDEPSQPKPRRNLLFASMMKERERVVVDQSGPVGSSASARHARDPEAPRPASRADRPSAPPDHNASSVTVLRSGVVNGMAYSLYSDGTIDAQLSEGTMRFASIDRLRAHLDQGSDRPSPK